MGSTDSCALYMCSAKTVGVYYTQDHIGKVQCVFSWVSKFQITLQMNFGTKPKCELAGKGTAFRNNRYENIC